MAGKTIRGPVDITVTLGSGQYKSPLSITGAGSIDPAGYGSVGIYLPQLGSLAVIVNRGDVYGSEGAYGHTGQAGGNAIDLFSAATLNNSGIIAAGEGGDSNDFGGAGGIGVDVRANATLTNSGKIFGGYGNYGYSKPGDGGDGVDLEAASTLTNSGSIQGGTGGRSNYYDGRAFETITGGIGLNTGYEAVVTNSGHITGGDGGVTDISSNDEGNGNSGADGVVLGAASMLSNSGSITGGAGGTYGDSSTYEGGNGGAGLYLGAATASNTGLIRGGAGGYASMEGGNGGIGVAAANYGVFTNTGSVAGGNGGVSNVAYGGNGGSGLDITENAMAANKGKITGGAGGYGGTGATYGDGGGQGGSGVYVYAGMLTNSGTIDGGAGATTPGDLNNSAQHHDNAGFGGDGIILGGFFSNPGFDTLSVVNYGQVRGGAGGNITSDEGTAGNGGYGVYVGTGTFTNHGSVFGGAGGYVGQGGSTYIIGGAGGAGGGVALGGTLINTGTIQGGTGGSNIYYGAGGGVGVVILGGTFIDSGLVRGGKGGDSQGAGPNGGAVYFKSTLGGTLVVDPGASFVGNVVANFSDPDVLVVAGSSSVALTGFNAEFTGFSEISFASGAIRTIEGGFYDAVPIVGFSTGDNIVIDNFAATPGATTVDGGYLAFSGTSVSGYLTVSLKQAKDLIISGAGGNTTIAAAAATGHTIGSKMAQLVVSGGAGGNSLIEAGGMATIYQGGTAANPTLAGGTLVLDAGAAVTGGISFTSATGALIIDSTKMPTAAISGFIAGDKIELAGLVYNKSDFVTVGTAGFVTISSPGKVEILSMTGVTKGETDFKFSTGSVLTRIAETPKMAFLAPDQASSVPEITPMLTGFAHLMVPDITPISESGKVSSALEAATLQNTGPLLTVGLGREAVSASLHPEIRVLLGHP